MPSWLVSLESHDNEDNFTAQKAIQTWLVNSSSSLSFLPNTDHCGALLQIVTGRSDRDFQGGLKLYHWMITLKSPQDANSPQLESLW